MLGFLYEAFVLKTIANFVKENGELVSKENKKARLEEACNGCEFKGIVQPEPYIKGQGCKKCGCPFATKAAMKSMERLLDGIPYSKITPKEVAQVKAKLLAGQPTRTEIIICPHPDGNKWAPIDSKFTKSK